MRSITLTIGVALASVAALTASAAASPTLPQPSGSTPHDTALLRAGSPASAPASVVFERGERLASPPALKGVRILQSADIANPNGAQSSGSVSCPAGTVAFGGGARGDSTNVHQDLHSSFPIVSNGLAVGWSAAMDNTSGAASGFTVFVVCAKKPTEYAVASVSFSSPAMTHGGGTVPCPRDSRGLPMKPTGGGAQNTSPGLDQTITGILPTNPPLDFDTEINNLAAQTESGTAYAICGKLRTYTSVAGTSVNAPSGAQTMAQATCPAGKLAVGGGGFAFSTQFLTLGLNSSYPSAGDTWQSRMNNTGTATMTNAHVICL
jgi:hypothetical protein